MKTDLNKTENMYKKNKDMFEDNKPLIITKDGTDVIFNFKGGKLSEWKGTLTSAMAVDHDGRRVLRWLLDKDFNEDALEIIQQQLDEVYM